MSVYKYILSTYAIGTACVVGANSLDLGSDSLILNTFLDMHNLKDSVGKTVATTTILFSPFLVPVYSISIPLMWGYETLNNYNKKQYD